MEGREVVSLGGVGHRELREGFFGLTIRNTNQQTIVHKIQTIKIQEKAPILGIVLLQVEPISRLKQLISIKIS